MKFQKSLVALAAIFVATGVASAADAPAKPAWQTSAAIGLTLTSGNSETVLFTGDLNSSKKAEHNEYILGASGAYGENQGQKANELLRGFGQWNHLFSDRWYGFARGEALHDGIAAVRYRLTGAAGVGYYAIKNDKTRLSFEAGPGYVYERLSSGLNNFVTARIAERFEHKLSDSARVWQSAEYLPAVEDFTSNYVMNFEVGIESALTKKLSLRAVFQDTYDSTPATGRVRNDLKLVTGLAYKF